MKFGAIVLAAGSSTRYGGEKKQDLEFHGKQLWRYSYETALRVVGEGNIVAVGKDFYKGAYTKRDEVALLCDHELFGKFICIHNPLTKYRIHGDNLQVRRRRQIRYSTGCRIDYIL